MCPVLPLLFSLCALAAPGPYLGQKLPGPRPEPFAPGLVATGMPTRDITFSPDGRELYFRVNTSGFTHSAILGCRLGGRGWSVPEVPAFAADPRWRTLEPAISPDGRRFYFVSDRPEDPAALRPGPMGIWVMERRGEGWGPARRLGPDINGPDGSFRPCPVQGGALYFARDGADGLGSVWRAAPQGAGFARAERLPEVVQAGRSRYNPYVTPDEGCMILCAGGAPGAVGGLDYVVLFRDGRGRWSRPQNLGPLVNGAGHGEISATLSPDGQYLFFASERDEPGAFRPGEGLTRERLRALDARPGRNGRQSIYWMEAGFLEALRRSAVFPEDSK